MDGISRTLYIPLYGKAKVSRMGIILNDKSQRRFGKRTLCPWVKDQNQSGPPISLQCGQGSLMIGQKCN